MNIKCEKPKLKLWLQLQEIQSKILDAVEHRNLDDVAHQICSYVSTASLIQDTEKLDWQEVAQKYAEITQCCIPTIDFPIFSTSIIGDKEMWDYEGRLWYKWLHSLSSKYHWTAEYIAELEFEDAIGLLQEITVEDQLEKEWQWSLTEIAYPYDEGSKKSIYKPLPRPEWMKMNKSIPITPPKATRMPVDMLPVGNIVKMVDMV